MKLTLKIGLAMLFLSLTVATQASEIDGTETHTILYGKEGDVEAAIGRLRDAGPEGLEALFAKKKEIQQEMERLLATDHPPELAPRFARLDSAIDRVGGARYCTASRLYWYTDLEQAMAAAQKSGKPILSLRMLGNLSDEFSCANSRFFRTTLYSNEEISKTLRERFVLHWKSVRPVPKVTIDFGDGRKLERTVTGNSIHYILMPDGQVVEAIPGLYGPKAFLKQVSRGEALVRLLGDASGERRHGMLADYHQQQAEEVTKAWQNDWRKAQAILLRGAANVPAQPTLQPEAQDLQQGEPAQKRVAAAPRAEAAARIARPKNDIEAPVILAVNLSRATPESLQDEKAWEAIAALHNEEARLDEGSRRVIRAQQPVAAAAGRRALTKRVVEDPLLRLFVSLESSIALDTVKNEYQFHRRIHEWLADGNYRPDVETLNERVYAELFLTPSSDPWLGLAPSNVYTGLAGGGVVEGGGK